MTTQNHFSKPQLDIFKKAGWILYHSEADNVLSMVLYDENPTNPKLIQFDFESQTLLILSQKLGMNPKKTPPAFQGAIPPTTSETIIMLNNAGMINPTLAKRLNRPNL